MGVHSRSFLKGKRFAFKNKDKLMCCERCVFGTGKHNCGRYGPGYRRADPWAVPSGEASRKPMVAAVPGKPIDPALRALMDKVRSPPRVGLEITPVTFGWAGWREARAKRREAARHV